MIVNSHPMLLAMEQSPFRFHLIGSRLVGVYSDKSDYDFISEVASPDEWQALKAWMTQGGFDPGSPGGYGPDARLCDTNVWTWKGSQYPDVDILPMYKTEAQMRLRWFAAMKDEGDDTGLIAKALKKEKAWPLLWAVLSRQIKDRGALCEKP